MVWLDAAPGVRVQASLQVSHCVSYAPNPSHGTRFDAALHASRESDCNPDLVEFHLKSCVYVCVSLSLEVQCRSSAQ